MVWLGRVALWVGVLTAVGAVVAGLARRPNVARAVLLISTAGALVATGVLARALVASDLSLTYVADHTRSGTSAPYRLAGLWAGMAGSLLFFAALVACAASVAALRAPSPRAVVIGGGGVVVALLGVVLVLADPFQTLAIPAIAGGGLVPILEHPAMLYHPPLLYLGLASLVPPALLTAGALADRRLDDLWLATVRRWLLVPWSLLGIGMVAGAHWAYVELGWGGYWAWDPVENTALLPWLAATAALHAALPPPRARTEASAHNVPRGLVAGLVLLAVLLALLGSLLTRSGATGSVHAFAEARSIGRALAVLLVLVTVACAALLRRALSASRGRLEPVMAAWVVVVVSVLGVVLAGSVWPLVSDLRGGNGVLVEGRYFSAFVGPLAVLGLALLTARHARRPAFAVAGGIVGLIVAVAGGWDRPFAVAVAALGAAAAVAAVSALVARPSGSHVAHLGMALLLVGVAGTSTGRLVVVPLARGDRVDVLGHEVVLRDVRVARPDVVVADVDVDGRRMRPELRAYPARGELLAESALRSGPLGDVQLMLRDAGEGEATLQIGVHPLQVWVWWGGLLVVAGGVISLAAARPGRRRPRAAGAGSRARSRSLPEPPVQDPDQLPAAGEVAAPAAP